LHTTHLIRNKPKNVKHTLNLTKINQITNQIH